MAEILQCLMHKLDDGVAVLGLSVKAWFGLGWVGGPVFGVCLETITTAKF
jgi:hypothetical protein